MDLLDFSEILDEDVKLVKINPDCETDILKSSVFKVFKNYCDKYGIKKIVVSLSGGVDSMVIAFCAIHYGVEVIAGHMNYANRDETNREQDFLEAWCNLYKIKFELLTFGELKRTNDNRNNYEKITRKMRYDFYKDLCKKYDVTGIFLGHHSNDVAENTFCNIVHGRSLIDLSVIKETSNVMGVTIYRPFRDIGKRDILEFAGEYVVPYFKDTTPDWSNRGKLRRQIFPLIEDTFEEKFQRKLYEIAVQSDNLYEIMEKMIVKPFLEKCVFYENGFLMEVGEKELGQNLMFWTIIMKDIMHGIGESMPKQSIMKIIVDKLNIGKEFKIDFKKDMKFFYRAGYIYVVKNFLVDFWRDLRGRYEKWDNLFEKVDREVSLEDVFFKRIIKGNGTLIVNPENAIGRKLGKIKNPVGKWEIYFE